ncbi:MAG: hypothetical protein IIA45_03505 [Bacteroidetes bacterium]|nr:hypothetical protein [Bacteroidota bacterium]
MKILRPIPVIIMLIAIAQIANGQDFKVPKNYSFEEKEDYAQYEEDILDCIDWLENTPINEERKNRGDATGFFLAWILGTPDVTIEINSAVLDFDKKNPSLLITFMGGWTRFALENPKRKSDTIKGTLAGVKSVIKVYKRDDGMKKDRKMEKLIKLQEEGELENWVIDKLKM